MTNVPVDDPEILRHILANTEALLLDFDGPICSVFAGFPASAVANQLRDVLADGGYRDLPEDITQSDDPFDILRHAAALGTSEARYVEAAFRAHEIEAIRSAIPTPGAHELIKTWKATGRQLAIVSNNSTAAIESYLHLHGLTQNIDAISARTGAEVSQLKPNIELLAKALQIFAISPNCATMIGDSITDVAACNKIGCRSIGYANRSYKNKDLASVHATAITGSIANLVSLISS